ncbi:hypothetical protein bcgnr5369_10210 [Bacillus cereus]|uniref:hypothetical protein n=1 Tax=Bacillus cereus TaxID=1396 RepID=UPI000BFE6B12|nr:hypothetical protein [Bacillus cereus]PGP12699.1 hypothetical protein COA01_33310 [Bacillus cereus]
MMHVIPGGDLLESDCNVIAHQANCFSKMKRGLANKIRVKYKGAYEADLRYPLSPDMRLGRTSYWTDEHMYIFNLYGQKGYGTDKQYTDYRALTYAMLEMLEIIQKVELENPNFKAKIGMPYLIGCDLAGGEWSKVEKIIHKIFVEIGNRDIFLYDVNNKSR